MPGWVAMAPMFYLSLAADAFVHVSAKSEQMRSESNTEVVLVFLAAFYPRDNLTWHFYKDNRPIVEDNGKYTSM